MATDSQPSSLEAALIGVEPLLKTQLRRRLGVTLSPTDFRAKNLDAQDLLVEMQIRLLGKTSAADAGIRDFTAYARTVSDSVINDYIRHRHPAWTRLKNRFRRFTEQSKSCSVWEDESEGLVFGFKGWLTEGRPIVDRERVLEVLRDPSALAAYLPNVHPDMLKSQDWERVGEAIVAHMGNPVPLDDVVSMVARVLKVEDPVEVADVEDPVPGAEFRRSFFPEPYQYTLEREWLTALWSELMQLLVWHRAAFLLNMPKEYGDVQEFPASGVASAVEIGRSLEFSPEQFARFWEQWEFDGRDRELVLAANTSYDTRFAVIWKRLPLEDILLAKGLSVTRAQVIGYRNKAKEKIQRRMAQAGFGRKQDGHISED